MRRAVLILALATAAGCAKRSAAYRFHGPLVSSVSATELPPSADHTRHRRRARLIATSPAVAISGPRAEHQTGSRADTQPGAAHALVATLRALVGLRMKHRSDIDLVMEALEAIGGRLGDAARAIETGAALVAYAESRGAITASGSPLLGDLVAFDSIDRKTPADLIGVVSTVRADGTVEFIYLARNVVRRGFLNLSRPDEKKDAHGRVLNTIIRQAHGHGKRGDSDLAGQRFAAFLRLDRLAH